MRSIRKRNDGYSDADLNKHIFENHMNMCDGYFMFTWQMIKYKANILHFYV